MAYVNVHVLRHLKEELAWVIDKWLWVISNKILFKIVLPLRNQRIKQILYLKHCVYELYKLLWIRDLRNP